MELSSLPNPIHRLKLRTVAVLLSLSVLWVIQGCAGQGRVRDIVGPAVEATVTSEKCPTDPTELGLTKDASNNGGGKIPENFISERVVWCYIQGIDNAGRGVARFHYEVKMGAVSSDLIAALGLPDRSNNEAVCAADDEGPIYVLLVDQQSRAVHVRLPEDECGKFRPDTLNALKTIPFQTVESFVVEANQSILK